MAEYLDEEDVEAWSEDPPGDDRPARWPSVVLLAVMCLGVGAAIRGYGIRHNEERQSAELLSQFVRSSQPLHIEVDWQAQLTETPDAKSYLYQGPAQVTLRNASDHVIHVNFPPQRSRTYTVRRNGHWDVSHVDATPDWATDDFVLTLNPGETREFETSMALTTSDRFLDDDAKPGPYMLDFAAPSDADDWFVTGTVYSSMTLSGPEALASR
ncbi:MAG: hypothetical protein KF774_21915 [Planctomyces sp.]|nr:hypothetical protein [Planctomyces sp.]